MRISVVTGQTATGKTSYAVKYAKKHNADIICADSRQMYEGLRIISGSDIPTSSQFHQMFSVNLQKIGYHIVEGVKIWLALSVPLSCQLSADLFTQYTKSIFNYLESENQNAVLVGGNGFYLRYLLTHMQHTSQSKIDTALRKELNALTLSDLKLRLSKISPGELETMNHSDVNNPYRIIRRIERQLNPIQNNKSSQKMSLNLSQTVCMLTKNQIALEKRIRKRVISRVKKGAVKEIQLLVDRGFNQNHAGMNTIGCTELLAYIHNQINNEELVNRWTTSELQYAKRQKLYLTKYFPDYKKIYIDS